MGTAPTDRELDEQIINAGNSDDEEDNKEHRRLLVNSGTTAMRRAAKYRQSQQHSRAGAVTADKSCFLTRADKETEVHLSTSYHQRSFIFLPIPHEQRNINPRELFLIFQKHSGLVHKNMLLPDWERKHSWDHLRTQLEDEFALLYPEMPPPKRKHKSLEEYDKLKAAYEAHQQKISSEKLFLRKEFEKTCKSDLTICSASKRNMTAIQFIECCVNELALPLTPEEARAIYQGMNQVHRQIFTFRSIY